MFFRVSSKRHLGGTEDLYVETTWFKVKFLCLKAACHFKSIIGKRDEKITYVKKHKNFPRVLKFVQYSTFTLIGILKHHVEMTKCVCKKIRNKRKDGGNMNGFMWNV